MFNNILIVCVGNICRSPMAEYLLQQKIKKQGLDTCVSSAGLGALVGQGADEYAIEVMTEHGVAGVAHRARQLNNEMVKQNELILVMEHWQQKEIESLYPYARGRVHLLGKWGETEISDPYRKPKEAFVHAYEKINNACDEWCDKLC
ncbi:MAG: low molecular weight phosphotyrosine protein phosphatase [Gammaproteobacteria bacterium]|nr:low molecular weight phosphotyrosine protein phosphatase [Gammaproteobacteria bacterium]